MPPDSVSPPARSQPRRGGGESIERSLGCGGGIGDKAERAGDQGQEAKYKPFRHKEVEKNRSEGPQTPQKNWRARNGSEEGGGGGGRLCAKGQRGGDRRAEKRRVT
mmetsp:Transcript_28112/g.74207  ORF Transcript_28112/g.74207 Transcript_28112/m.74207 type:complete len:106 (-) Transcript_28112:753-1070(-)